MSTKKQNSFVYLKKRIYLCSPNHVKNLIINHIENEQENISALEPEKKEQARLPFKNGYS